MLKISGSQLVKLLNSRYDSVMSLHPNYIPSSDILNCYNQDIRIECLADYTNSVIQTILYYFQSHTNTRDDRIGIDYNQDGSSSVQWLYQTHHNEQWLWVKEEILNTILDLLSNDTSTVFMAVSWSMHLAHLAGWEGIELSNHREFYDSRTGSLLLDHGKEYGITYDLIDSLSNGSIESVFPNSLDYI